MFLTIATILGGLGIFLLAVTLMTEGLRMAAGDGLKDALARSTRTPLRGLAFGFVVTSLVRSSSAVTVATIGFVNAGLLTLGQSLGVVYGANIGTTTTGWLVALVGLDFRIEALAMPLIGLGMLARLAAGDRRVGALGEALAGFGLFFIGIQYLQDAFAGFADEVDVAAIQPGGFVGLVLYVILGFVMTLVTQSSGAAMTITLTAVAGGILTVEAGAATVIGTNIGTTSTAALAAIGATANARRVAAAHVLFNAFTGMLALLLLPGMLWILRFTAAVMESDQAPTALLAGFHTLFNVLGVLAIWPWTARLAAFLERRFVSTAERLARPQFIDRTVIGAPALALEALARELDRATALARDLVASTWGPAAAVATAAERRMALRGLLEAVTPLVAELGEARLRADEADRLTAALRMMNYLEDVVTLARTIDEQASRVDAIRRPPVGERIESFEAAGLTHVARCDPGLPGFAAQVLESGYESLRSEWHALKSDLLDAAIQHRIPLGPLNPALEALRSCLKVTEQMTKVAIRLARFASAQAPGTGQPAQGPTAAPAADPSPDVPPGPSSAATAAAPAAIAQAHDSSLAPKDH